MDQEYEDKSKEILDQTCENCVHFSEVKCDSPAFKEARLCSQQNIFIRPENDACLGFKNKRAMIYD